jgi:DNA-binding HxlR family transcriptional regulator
MDAIGERWALLVVRELVFGPKRFGDLRTGLPRASQNVLSQRLKELEASGVVQRVELGPPASAHAYQLTERGRQLEPVLIALSRWGAHIPARHDAELSTDAFMLLLKALYFPPEDARPTTAIRLLVGADSFDVRVEPGSISVTRSATGDVDATVRAPVPVLWDLIFTEVTLESSAAAGILAATGDLAAAQEFFRLFRVPET